MACFRASALAVLTLSAAATIVAGPARAQSASCADGQKLLEQRGALVQGFANMGKKKMTPVQACGKFNALVSNGTKLLAWIEQNGAWCNLPEQVKTRVTDDHQQAQKIRGQACSAAAKQRQLESQAARARQGGGAPGGFGGNGGDLVSGAMRVPQGAL